MDTYLTASPAVFFYFAFDIDIDIPVDPLWRDRGDVLSGDISQGGFRAMDLDFWSDQER